ncbi:hypothetical protein F5Y14DRAFT_401573 [Nemania sp. NC0429]|nr:hypothetical protein F5Y14DRAFT_401573 [Nemania sp. NC0429]
MRFPVNLGFHRIIYHRLLLPGEKSYGDGDEFTGGPPKRPSWYTVILHIAIVALAVLFITVSTLYLQLLREGAPRPLLTCGKSVEEARRTGCSFDVLTKTWLPAACPRHYEQEFLQFPSTRNMTDWKYWSDAAATKEITDEEMALIAQFRPGPKPLWVSTMRMHLAHCAFGLMRRSVSMDAGERVDLAMAPLSHAKHCIEMLFDAAMLAPGIDEPLAQGGVIFGAC